jgi:hypothetical protein
MNQTELVFCRVIFLWIIAVSSGLGYIASREETNTIFRFGPNSSLKILGIYVDDEVKYSVVVVFCFINSVIRTINQNVLQSWIINTVQDSKTISVLPRKAYEISFIHCVYIWLDFFMYMNILLSQIDMLLIEVVADLVMTSVITTYYLNEKNINIESNTIINDFV